MANRCGVRGTRVFSAWPPSGVGRRSTPPDRPSSRAPRAPSCQRWWRERAWLAVPRALLGPPALSPALLLGLATAGALREATPEWVGSRALPGSRPRRQTEKSPAATLLHSKGKPPSSKSRGSSCESWMVSVLMRCLRLTT